MAVVVGTDEAGYGPNLGPLVITATAWEAATAQPQSDDPSAWLGPTPTTEPDSLPLFGDSKRLFASGGSLAALERGVWSALAVIDPALRQGSTWRNLVERLDPGRIPGLEQTPWYAAYDRAVPVHIPLEAIAIGADQCIAQCAQAGRRLCGLRARIVSEAEFNAGVAAYGNKATALSHWTLELVRDVLTPVKAAEVGIWSDKHGGRNRYAAMLQQHLTATWIQVHEESRLQSVYSWRDDGRRFEARFMARGEAWLPVALASMISKYLRELAMDACNAFWRARVPGLRPTAGYPVDARRFRAEIREAQRRLGIADATLWRTR